MVYAIGTLAAAAFGAVLYTVVSGDSIPQALGGIIQRALTSSVSVAAIITVRASLCRPRLHH